MSKQLSLVVNNDRYDWRPKPLPSLNGIDDIILDCETSGLDHRGDDRPGGVALRYGDKSQYIPWAHRGGGNHPEERVREWFKQEVRGKRITNLNTRFDNHMLYKWGVDLEAQDCTLRDVGNWAALLNDQKRRGFGLDALGHEYVGRGKVDFDPSHILDYHASEAEEYACGDVDLVDDLVKVLWPKIVEDELTQVALLEDELIFAVCEMERNAAPIDEEKLKRWVRESEHQFLRYVWEIESLTGEKLDPTKTRPLINLFKKLDLGFLDYTDTGQPSFADDVLELYNHPVVELIRKARKIASLRSKYLVSYTKVLRNGLLYYNLHQLRADEHGTISGRFSSSDKNIQQVKAVEKQIDEFGLMYIIRELFIPAEGLFLASDAKQIEYRLFAHYASAYSRRFLEVYENDPEADFHARVAEMLAPFKEGLTRKPVKNLNFAKVYGAGIAKVAAMLNVSESEAKAFVALYDREFPEARRLLRQASDTAKKRGYVTTLLKRRARFPEEYRLHKALNSIIQGSAADIMKLKLVELHKERKYTNFKMRFTVHDEVCGDVPDAEAAKRVDEVLNRQAIPLRVPILWKTSTGKHWAQADSPKHYQEAA